MSVKSIDVQTFLITSDIACNWPCRIKNCWTKYDNSFHLCELKWMNHKYGRYTIRAQVHNTQYAKCRMYNFLTGNRIKKSNILYAFVTNNKCLLFLTICQIVSMFTESQPRFSVNLWSKIDFCFPGSTYCAMKGLIGRYWDVKGKVTSNQSPVSQYIEIYVVCCF